MDRGSRGGSIGRLALGLWASEQFARPRDVVGTGGLGEQAVVADAVEALRQDVAEEAADELIGCKGHELVSCAAVGAIVLVPEGDAVLRGERKDGTKLKPPMALQRYATMTDDDLNDLIAYLRTATTPRSMATRATPAMRRSAPRRRPGYSGR